MPNHLLEAALNYARRGWSVLPCHWVIHQTDRVLCSCGKESGEEKHHCKSAGKHPKNFDGLLGATTNEGTIREWWSKWPRANIAIRTGDASGFCALDVDLRTNGEQSLQDLIEKNGPLPDTVQVLTGGGGWHYYFVHEPWVRNSASAIAPGLDMRGDGGYVMAPPSLHASGRTYEWELSSDPTDTPVAPLPTWIRPGAAAVSTDGPGNIDFSVSGIVKADGSPVDPGGRNMAAASLAGQCIQDGMALHDVMRALDDWNQTNPVPLGENELKRTVASVTRTHVRRNPGAAVPISAEAIAEEAAVAVFETSPETGTGAPIDEEPARRIIIPLPKLSEELLDPPGFVGEICRWMNETAYLPQPVLVLGNALAFFGAVIGRKVATPTDLRSNLYCLGVGESGCGKDHSRKCVKRLCEAAGLSADLLGGEDVSSDSAILAAVHEHKTVLFQFDEVGHMIRTATSKYSASHQQAIPVILTKLFSSANTTYIGKEYADRKVNRRRDIEQPNVCIYGTTVPSRLYDGLSPEEVRDGFLGRMLVFPSADPDPGERERSASPVPPGIVAMVQAWFNRKDQPAASGNVAAVTQNVPRVVPIDDDATVVFRKFRSACKKHRATHRAENAADALWSRALEHALKVALIVACGIDFASPVIAGDVAEWSTQLVGTLTDHLVSVVGDSVSGSEYGREKLRVLRAIKRNGHEGITATSLNRATQGLTPRSRTEIITDLLVSALIFKKEDKPTRGRVATIYVASGS